MANEWQNNPRLRLLAYLAAFIGWGYGVWLLADHNAVRVAQIAESELRLQRVLPAGGSDWLRQRNDSRHRLLAWNAVAWSETSASLAEAAFRDWLAGTLGSVKLTPRSLRVSHLLPEAPGKGTTTDNGPALPAGFGQLSAQIETDFNAPALARLLELLQAEARQVSVIRLAVRNPAQGAGSIELEVRALMKVSTAEVQP